MSNVAIVTDSTSYIPKDLLKQHNIHVVANVVNWGTQSYRDSVDLESEQFFERLKTDPVHPTTAVASLGEIQAVYQRAAETADTVIGIHLSSKLSNTYNVAREAAGMLSGKRIEVIDSQSTAMALGFITLIAARAAQAGKSAEEIIQLAQNAIPCSGAVFTVDTLKYLQRGGRIGAAQAFVGGVLDLKPVLELRDGVLGPLERVRSKKKAVERVAEYVIEKVSGKSPIRLSTLHAAARPEAEALLEVVKARLGPVEEAFVSDVSPTVGTHLGPGTVGLAFCAGA